MNTPVARKVAAVDARRVAAARAAREAAARRRALAAKRRMLVLALAGGVTISAWILTAMVSFPWVLSALFTAGTVAVVELGRRAAVAGAAADAELAQRVADAERRARRMPLATRVVNKGSGRIDFADQSSALEEAASSLRVEVDPQVQVESTWTPVPVPPPAYTLKAEVRRKVAEPNAAEPSASQASNEQQPSEQTSATAVAAVLSAPAPAEVPNATPVREAEEPAATTASLNVQEILARRRAVG